MAVPEFVAVYRLTAIAASKGLEDVGYQGRVGERMRVFRQDFGVSGGAMLRELEFTDDRATIEATILLAVPIGVQLASTGAFTVSDCGVTGRSDLFADYVRHHLEVLQGLQVGGELLAYHSMTRSMRRIDRFGKLYGRLAPKLPASNANTPRTLSEQHACPYHPDRRPRSAPPSPVAELVLTDENVLVRSGR